MDLVDSVDQDVVSAVFRSIMGASVPIYAPVTGEQGGHTGAARAGDVEHDQENQRLNSKPESIAVKEGEVGGGKVGATVDPDGQLTCEVGLAFWDCWE